MLATIAYFAANAMGAYVTLPMLFGAMMVDMAWAAVLFKYVEES